MFNITQKLTIRNRLKGLLGFRHVFYTFRLNSSITLYPDFVFFFQPPPYPPPPCGFALIAEIKHVQSLLAGSSNNIIPLTLMNMVQGRFQQKV